MPCSRATRPLGPPLPQPTRNPAGACHRPGRRRSPGTYRGPLAWGGFLLSVKLSVHPAEEGAAPPLHEGPILFVRVHNQRHRATVPFDERSRGFVWFFSFLAYFSELEAGKTSNLIVLLDEPGLSLHARAQQDLLRLIDERLAPNHQVIYTTHSPFLVSPGQFNRVRTVIDHEKGGTKVSAEIFKADEDTVSPLLTAMGRTPGGSRRPSAGRGSCPLS